MKTAVVYYSWSGHTEAKAKALAQKENASLFEIKDAKRPGTLAVYTLGSFAAMRMKRRRSASLNVSLNDYDRIVILAPVWAGYPAPASLAAFDALPGGKQVAVVLVSGGGSSRCRAEVEKLVQSKGCRLASFEDVKGGQ